MAVYSPWFQTSRLMERIRVARMQLELQEAKTSRGAVTVVHSTMPHESKSEWTEWPGGGHGIHDWSAARS